MNEVVRLSELMNSKCSLIFGLLGLLSCDLYMKGRSSYCAKPFDLVHMHYSCIIGSPLVVIDRLLMYQLIEILRVPQQFMGVSIRLSVGIVCYLYTCWLATHCWEGSY
uniref:Uncharacterized protein n=1 Tax=Chytriomyces confervae TaxID=246404 RepID=A0A4P8NPB0_9FUNG|nr:hypothetical protein [Chytriomyces confervae]QCQ69070.1 hypothetical protein [Chytriomyces confervae]